MFASSKLSPDEDQYLDKYADQFLDGIDTTRPYGNAWKREIIRSERQSLLNRTRLGASSVTYYMPRTTLRDIAILESNGTGDYLSQLMWDGEE